MSSIDYSPSFCIVVPAYNEEQGIERCVRTLCAAMREIPSCAALVVVNDGSRDQTGAILDRLALEYPLLDVVHCENNGGYGGAVRRGILRAAEGTYDYALFMDSDLTNDPKFVADFVVEMRRGADVIKASRYVSGGRAEGVPAYRVAISVAGNRIASGLFGLPIRDCTNGFQAMKVDLLRRMPLRETGFAVIMEQMYYAKYLATTFAEVPYTLTARTDYIRKSSFYYRPSAFYNYLKYPLKCFFRIAPEKAVLEPSPARSEAIAYRNLGV